MFVSKTALATVVKHLSNVFNSILSFKQILIVITVLRTYIYLIYEMLKTSDVYIFYIYYVANLWKVYAMPPKPTPVECIENQLIKPKVAECMETLASDNTGYILASCHNIQVITPVENVMAMYKTAKEYRGI